jgi:plastocyanin
MKMRYLSFLILFQFINQTVLSQTTHDISVSNFSFTPAQITITVGDKVIWTNSGGLHNVIADDNSFTSGAVSSSAWVYEHTFNSVGNNPYYCSAHGAPGGVGMSGVVIVENATDVTDDNNSVFKFNLIQNFPNPFNPSTKISYTIPERGNVSLKVFNLLGSQVAELVNGEIEAGSYDITFNASNLPTGTYFYRLQTSSYVETKKMILLK